MAWTKPLVQPFSKYLIIQEICIECLLCFAPGQPLDSVCWGCHDGPSVCTALVPNENDQNFLLKTIFINYTHFVKGTYPKSLIREFTKIMSVALLRKANFVKGKKGFLLKKTIEFLVSNCNTSFVGDRVAV